MVGIFLKSLGEFNGRWSVLRRAVIIGLAVLWMCASGVWLCLAQILAWGSMFAGYLPNYSVVDAVAMTLDPELPCAQCLSIRAARDSVDAPIAVVLNKSLLEKLLLAFSGVVSVFVVWLGLFHCWRLRSVLRPESCWGCVLLPPPRVV